MNRRGFVRTLAASVAGVAGMALLGSTPKVVGRPPCVISLDCKGGFLVPPEYAKALERAMRAKGAMSLNECRHAEG